MSCCCVEDTEQVEIIDTGSSLPAVLQDEHSNFHTCDGHSKDVVTDNATRMEAEQSWTQQEWTDADQAWRDEQARWAEQSKEKAWVDNGFYFKVFLSKYDWEEKLSMTLNHDPEGTELSVLRASGRALLEWNQWYPDAKVLAGDRLVSVNGVTGNAFTLIQTIKESQHLELDIYRLVYHTVSLTKQEPLGLILTDAAEVAEIRKPSTVAKYNNDSMASSQILIGSRIVKLNGVTTDPAVMSEVINQTQDGVQLSMNLERRMQ